MPILMSNRRLPLPSSGSVVLPGTPTNVLLSLQGQTTPNNTPSAPTPSSPDFDQITWTQAAAGTYPIASNNIYRSTDGVSFSLYANTGTPVSSFSDAAATLCVNGTAGGGPSYYTANTYWYKVSAIDTHGNEGPLSATQSCYWYKNNVQYGLGGDFSYPGGNVTVDYHDTSIDPLGAIKFSWSGSSFPGFQPYAGGILTLWNFWAGAFNYLNFEVYPTVANWTAQLNPLRVGDVVIYGTNGSGISFPLSTIGPANPVANAWNSYKIALATMLLDHGPTNSYSQVQKAVYKWAIQDTTGNASGAFYVRNVFYSPS